MRDNEPDRPPTYDEIAEKARVQFGKHLYLAAWYPQMGGYVGRCWVLKNDQGCFDVWLWHDGSFPLGEGVDPFRLHHCAAEQFIEFGKLVEETPHGWNGGAN